jgi:hypothetical protein
MSEILEKKCGEFEAHCMTDHRNIEFNRKCMVMTILQMTSLATLSQTEMGNLIENEEQLKFLCIHVESVNKYTHFGKLSDSFTRM